MENNKFKKEFYCPDVYGYEVWISSCKTAAKVKYTKKEDQFSDWYPIDWLYNVDTGANDPHIMFPDGGALSLFFLIFDWNK